MRKLLLCFLLITINTFASTPNVVLLSSIDTPKIWYHSKKWEIEQSLEKIFKNRFSDSGYNVVIKGKVDQQTLKAELSNPDNIAIFWVSHAAGISKVSDGVSTKAAIVDYYGKDVKDLFKQVHPNLRFLGLIGCNAKGLMNKYKEEGHYSNSSSLKIHSFDKKVDARIGLRKSIKNSAIQLGRIEKRFLSYPKIYSTSETLSSFKQDKSCLKKSYGYKVELTRFAKEQTSAVAIKSKGNVLALLPALEEGQEYSTSFIIEDTPEMSKSSFKLSVDSNIFYSPKKLYLGEFELNSNWDASWNVFARRDGEPLGVTRNLYRYRGKLPSLEYKTSFQKYKCFNK